MTLNETETRKYEDAGPKGAAFRNRIRRVALAVANATGKPVEISSWDGVIFDQILPDGHHAH